MRSRVSSDQESALAGIRRRRAVQKAIWIGLLPAVVFLSVVVQLIAPDRLAVLINVSGAVFLLAIAASGATVATARCPRCHRPFFARGLMINAIRRSCAHCGLPLGG